MAPLVQYQHSTLVCFGILSTIPQVLGLSDEAKIGITSLVLVAFIGGATIAISILLLWLNVVQAKGVTDLADEERANASRTASPVSRHWLHLAQARLLSVPDEERPNISQIMSRSPALHARFPSDVPTRTEERLRLEENTNRSPSVRAANTGHADVEHDLSGTSPAITLHSPSLSSTDLPPLKQPKQHDASDLQSKPNETLLSPSYGHEHAHGAARATEHLRKQRRKLQSI